MNRHPGTESTLHSTLWFPVLLFSALITLPLMASLSHAAGISPASRCHPMAVDTCSLPFPSDLFRNTGGTYNYSDYILDRRVSGSVRNLLPARYQFPDNFLPGNIINNSSGFSPLGPVLFELNDWPINAIPKNGDGYLHVYNMATGERVPMVVSLSKVAKAENNVREPRPVIIGWPRSRFEFGERYVAVLLKPALNQFPGAAGTELFVPSEGTEKALNRNAGWILNFAYSPVLDFMEDQSIAPEDVLSFTWFTVKSEQEVTEPMQYMVDRALNTPNYVTELAPHEPLGDDDYGLATLTGKLSMVNFRSDDGGVYPPYEPVADLSRRRVDFILTLPKQEQSAPVPVAVSGHGLGNFKELTRSVYRMDDRLGIASLAIDHPNHGARVTLYDDFKEPHISTAVTTPLTIMQLLGMFVQGTVDQVLAIHSAKHLLPQALSNWQHPDELALPALDGSRVMYDGLSLGAMLGVGVGAVAPELEGAYLVNGAGSLIQIFTESTFWTLTSNVIPANMNGAEMTFVMAMMQHYLDIADGNNFAHRFRDLPAGFNPRPLAMHYSLGDGSMTNDATRASAELADLPLLKTVIEPEPFLRNGQNGRDDFDNGFGLVQSGFGNSDADRILDSLDALDAGEDSELPDLSGLDGLFDLDLDSIMADNPTLASLQAILGVRELADIQQLADTVYSGELDNFLTHFNRNGEAARHRAIDWRCDLFQLDQTVCANAKAIASEEAAKAEEGDLGDLTGDADDGPMGEITDAIEQGLDNVSVTDGSGGVMDPLVLLLWLLTLAPMVLLRALQNKTAGGDLP